MSNERDIVKRYDMVAWSNGLGVDAEVSPAGPWVRYEDYESLRTRLAAAEKVVEQASKISGLERFGALNSALTAYHNTEKTNGGAKC